MFYGLLSFQFQLLETCTLIGRILFVGTVCWQQYCQHSSRCRSKKNIKRKPKGKFLCPTKINKEPKQRKKKQPTPGEIVILTSRNNLGLPAPFQQLHKPKCTAPEDFTTGEKISWYVYSLGYTGRRPSLISPKVTMMPFQARSYCYSFCSTNDSELI